MDVGGSRSRDKLRGVSAGQVVGVAFTIAALITLLIVGGGLAVLYVVNHQSCTIGVVRTDAQVTVEGPNARKHCDELIRSSGGAGYYTEPDPTATLMCRVHLDNDLVTVRDKGAFKLIGNQMCDNLAAWMRARGAT